jgi:hypothetical protein
MSTILRVTKHVDAPRALIPLPFKTAMGGTALLDETRPPYVEVWLPADAVEVVSTDEGFILDGPDDERKADPLDQLDGLQRTFVAVCVNARGDGRIGMATRDNLGYFPVPYMRDCLSGFIEDLRRSGQGFAGPVEILEILVEDEPDQASRPILK